MLAVAVSGGLDSTVLLHALARQARDLGVQVLALHVDHGLQAVSSAWGERLKQQCRQWRARGLPVRAQVFRVRQSPPPGASIEAWARQVRYAALADMARAAGATHVWLAHHRRDQAETFLLQALRGAGPAGLAAMPQALWRDGLCWLRPWLKQPRQAIEAYARRWRLRWVEDATNADIRFARNRLRHEVWPVLLDGFAQAEAALGQSARQSARAAELMREVGQQDLAALLTAEQGLRVPGWLQLSPARRHAVLWVWCQRQGRIVPESLLERLNAELPGARSGARWPCGAEGTLGCYRGELRWLAPGLSPQLPKPPSEGFTPFPGLGRHVLPAWGGVLEVRAVEQGGIAAHRLAQAVLAARQGAEQFQLAPNATARALKKQYQARGVPVWQRHGPLVLAEARPDAPLLFAPGLGVDARALAAPGEAQWLPDWRPELVPSAVKKP